MGDPIRVTQPTSLNRLLYPNMGTVDWAACCYNPSAPHAGAVADYTTPSPLANWMGVLGASAPVAAQAGTILSKH